VNFHCCAPSPHYCPKVVCDSDGPLGSKSKSSIIAIVNSRISRNLLRLASSDSGEVAGDTGTGRARELLVVLDIACRRLLFKVIACDTDFMVLRLVLL
jgi:hypothetical protein